MKIVLNGEARQLRATTLDAALVELGYGCGVVATAVNGRFVPVTGRAGVTLGEGDRLEVLTPRQGG